MTKHARRAGVAPSLVPPEEPEVVSGPGGVAEMFLQHMDPEDHQGTENAAESASVMRPDAQLDGAGQQAAQLAGWLEALARMALSQ